jgi:hypothetical protein
MSNDQREQEQARTSWQWRGLSEREEECEQRGMMNTPMARRSSRHASWPTTPNQTSSYRARHGRIGRTQFQRLSAADQQAFRDALTHKYDTVEGYLRVRCLQTRSAIGLSCAQERFDELFVRHVHALWNATSGTCAATGAAMVWRREDVRRRPGLAVVLIPIDSKLRMGIGNVALVCRAVSPFVKCHSGLERAMCVASAMKPFILFKRDMHGYHFTEICTAWSDTCTRKWGEDPWCAMAQEEAELFMSRMTATRTETWHDTQTVQEACILAQHAAQLMDAQAGRCAISGFVMSARAADSAKQASIDRIDGRAPHTPGNVRMTTLAMNLSRESMPDREFDDWILCIADRREATGGYHR